MNSHDIVSNDEIKKKKLFKLLRKLFSDNVACMEIYMDDETALRERSQLLLNYCFVIYASYNPLDQKT
jgi:hypothetical protein